MLRDVVVEPLVVVNPTTRRQGNWLPVWFVTIEPVEFPVVPVLPWLIVCFRPLWVPMGAILFHRILRVVIVKKVASSPTTMAVLWQRWSMNAPCLTWKIVGPATDTNIDFQIGLSVCTWAAFDFVSRPFIRRD